MLVRGVAGEGRAGVGSAVGGQREEGDGENFEEGIWAFHGEGKWESLARDERGATFSGVPDSWWLQFI